MLRALITAMSTIEPNPRADLFDKIESILSAKAQHHKPKQQEPGPLTEHEFFFDSGKRSLKYVCFGQSRADAQELAEQAMAGSYFKLRGENA
jgi:hypothetical protein